MSGDPVADAYEEAVRQVAGRLVPFWHRQPAVNAKAAQCGACGQPVKARYGILAFTAESGDGSVCLHHACASHVSGCIAARYNLGANFTASRWHPPDVDSEGVEALIRQAIEARSKTSLVPTTE